MLGSPNMPHVSRSTTQLTNTITWWFRFESKAQLHAWRVPIRRPVSQVPVSRPAGAPSRSSTNNPYNCHIYFRRLTSKDSPSLLTATLVRSCLPTLFNNSFSPSSSTRGHKTWPVISILDINSVVEFNSSEDREASFRFRRSYPQREACSTVYAGLEGEWQYTDSDYRSCV